MQIMIMVVNCHRVNDISSSLHLSPKTVNSYRYRIFEKLNVSSDVELALLAVRHGMLGNVAGDTVMLSAG
jgi:DNA-binding NarL/FixJ family response regulator